MLPAQHIWLSDSGLLCRRSAALELTAGQSPWLGAQQWSLKTNSLRHFRSTPKSRIIWVSCPSVRPSTKSFCVTWLWTWKGFRSCFCYYNTIRQVAAAFWGVDRQLRTGLIFYVYFYCRSVICQSCIGLYVLLLRWINIHISECWLCYRVAANGDTANKIGTYQIAVVAKHHGVPFYIAAPSTSVDLSISSGQHIVIEERPQTEMTCIAGVSITANGLLINVSVLVQ